MVTGASPEEYDLVVIGGGSGGLACAKAGTSAPINVVIYLLNMHLVLQVHMKNTELHVLGITPLFTE